MKNTVVAFDGQPLPKIEVFLRPVEGGVALTGLTHAEGISYTLDVNTMLVTIATSTGSIALNGRQFMALKHLFLTAIINNEALSLI
jgi:hypothetical protein